MLEFYKTETRQVTEWLVSDISNKSMRCIGGMDTKTLLDLVLEKLIELISMSV